MNLIRSQHYTHLSLLDQDGKYRPKPILIVGASGSGKSILVEDCIEEIEENIKDSISIFCVDESDVLESAFCMMPASDKNHLRKLKEQNETPEERKKVKLWVINGHGLKEWQKKEKSLPEFEVITFSAKKLLQREECMVLLESEEENKAVSLLMKCGDSLKSNEDLRFVKHYAKHLTQRKKIYFMGKSIESDEEPIADKSDLGNIEGKLQIFEHDNCIMPDDFKLNFDAKKLLREGGTRHIFIYKCLKQDYKLRDFFFFHIINEIGRNMAECKHPVNLIIEEIQSKAPYKGQGYKVVLAGRIGNTIGLLRKSGRGTSIFMVGRAWSRIADEIKDECKKQIIFHLEQNDMLKFVKVRNLGKKAKDIIERLEVGECILRGFETRLIKCKMPRHEHKHPQLQFTEIYKKIFPEKLRKYDEIIKLIDNEIKRLEKSYTDISEKEFEIKKALIRKQVMQKSRQGVEKDKIKEYEETEKQKKIEAKNKRDNEIIAVYNDLKSKGEKISYRIISAILESRGLNISYGTVKNVLDEFLNTDRGQE